MKSLSLSYFCLFSERVTTSDGYRGGGGGGGKGWYVSLAHFLLYLNAATNYYTSKQPEPIILQLYPLLTFNILVFSAVLSLGCQNISEREFSSL